MLSSRPLEIVGVIAAPFPNQDDTGSRSVRDLASSVQKTFDRPARCPGGHHPIRRCGESYQTELNTIEGYEAMHMIRKGQIRWLPKGDTVGQARFVSQLFGFAL
jgi:hypothetical protein